MKIIKNKIFIAGSILVINIVVFISLLIYKDKTMYAEDENTAVPFQMSSEETYTKAITLNKKIFAENRYKLEKKYNGKNDCDLIYTKLYVLIKYMPEIYNKVPNNENELETYYNNNKSGLNAKLSINNYDDFLKDVDNMRKIYSNEKSYYKNVKFIIDTYEEYDKYITCNFEIEFNNNQVLEYQLRFAKEANADYTVLFIPLKK